MRHLSHHESPPELVLPYLTLLPLGCWLGTPPSLPSPASLSRKVPFPSGPPASSGLPQHFWFMGGWREVGLALQ